MTGARSVVFAVASDEAGERLDRVCAARLGAEGVSRSLVARLCDEGAVTVDGRAAKASARVRAGETVAVAIPAPEPSTAVAEDIPLAVLYEDDAVLVVDKPAGLVVHPARGHASGTLVNAVLHHAEVDDGADALRPGIVHRLDKDTSGVLVVAKTAAAREALMAQFKAHSVERRYVAVVLGTPPDGVTYDTLHGRHPTDRLRFTTRVREGKRAVTTVRVLEPLVGGAAALVHCELRTGRTHQIRVHLAEAGHPLLGDALYGRPPRDPRIRKVAEVLGRQCLHAEVLGFAHPTTERPLRFVSPPPPDFAAAVEALRRL